MHFARPPAEEYTIPFGVADIKRTGTDVTVVATSLMVHKAIKVAEQLAGEGISVEVLDPRTLVPLDKESILASVEKTTRLVIASEDVVTCGFAAEIAALVAEHGLFFLDAPIKRVCVPDTPIPFAPAMETAVIPQEEDIMTAIRETLL